MDKPYRAPKRRGPPPALPGGRITSIKLGYRERALIRLYIRDSELNDTGAVLRAGLEQLCEAFTAEQVGNEIEAEREQERRAREQREAL